MNTIQLSEFTGKTAVIVQLGLPEWESQRLRSMGIFEGQALHLSRVNRNWILRAAGGRVAIANELAQLIFVRPTDVEAA